MSKTCVQKSSYSLPASDDMKVAFHPADSGSSIGSGSKAPEVIKEKHGRYFLFLRNKESIVKKEGWVCNELSRYRLDNKDLQSAELAFADAIQAFMEVLDFSNVVLINCNLGHGRRALAESMESPSLASQKRPKWWNELCWS
ncbi:hypothetical protein AMTR_s00090p00110300, partial [Amborella trichopoda]